MWSFASYIINQSVCHNKKFRPVLVSRPNKNCSQRTVQFQITAAHAQNKIITAHPLGPSQHSKQIKMDQRGKGVEFVELIIS